MNQDVVAAPREPLVSREEVSEYFGISLVTLNRLGNEDGLPYLRVSRVKRMYRWSEVLAWAENNGSRNGGEDN